MRGSRASSLETFRARREGGLIASRSRSRKSQSPRRKDVPDDDRFNSKRGTKKGSPDWAPLRSRDRTRGPGPPSAGAFAARQRVRTGAIAGRGRSIASYVAGIKIEAAVVLERLPASGNAGFFLRVAFGRAVIVGVVARGLAELSWCSKTNVRASGALVLAGRIRTTVVGAGRLLRAAGRQAGVEVEGIVVDLRLVAGGLALGAVLRALETTHGVIR